MEPAVQLRADALGAKYMVTRFAFLILLQWSLNTAVEACF